MRNEEIFIKSKTSLSYLFTLKSKLSVRGIN